MWAHRVRSFLLVLFAIALAVSGGRLVPAVARFADTEKCPSRIAAGTWETCPAPIIRCVFPSWGRAGACRWPVFIHGENFVGGASVALERGDRRLVALRAWLLSRNLVYAVFDLRGAEAGAYDVCLQWPDGRRAVLPGGFRVMAGCATRSGESTCPTFKVVYEGPTTGGPGEGTAKDDTGQGPGLSSGTGSGTRPEGAAGGTARDLVFSQAGEGDVRGRDGEPGTTSGKKEGENGLPLPGAPGYGRGDAAWLVCLGRGGAGTLRLVSVRPPGCGVMRACAVAPGLCVEGVVNTRPDGSVSVAFDLGPSVPEHLDIILFSPVGKPLYFSL